MQRIKDQQPEGLRYSVCASRAISRQVKDLLPRAYNYTPRDANLSDNGIPRQSLSSQLDDLTSHNWWPSKAWAACSRYSFRLDWLKSQTPLHS
ncbi:hypothetical protein OAR43_09350 [Gammaproteobacteria bacterium]|nr:hypothetical protein [Gammaproteobacteria bacterium]